MTDPRRLAFRLLVALLLVGAGPATRGADLATELLPRSAPEAQGMSSAGLEELVRALGEGVDSMHGLVVVRHGHVVAAGWWSPYAAEIPHRLYSLSKSYTSTAVGIAQAEGLLSIDDPVLSFFPDEAPASPSGNLRAMRVRDLLSMSTGHHAEEVRRFSFAAEDSLVRSFLALSVDHKPGTHFVYNTPATFLCSAIVQKVSGRTVEEFLGERLFGPLGTEGHSWLSVQGISLGGYGLRVRTEDIACLGQLYLQKGEWKGRRLLPASWVEAATSRQTSNGSNPESDWEQGYGFQFWRCRHGAYRGDGAFGQFCVVLPEHDVVVAITSGTGDMGRVLAILWDRLLPILAPVPLPADEAARASLERTLASLALPTVEGARRTDRAPHVSGTTYAFPDDSEELEAVTLSFDEEGSARVLVRRGGHDHRLDASHGRWLASSTTAFGPELASRDDTAEHRVAASGAWTSDDTYTAKVWYLETPYALTLRFRFSGDGELTLSREVNVAFGPRRVPDITGKRRALR